jgi:3-methyl-2-oxobutanoate hydroxymethyltransferase
MSEPAKSPRVTLRTLRKQAADGQKIAFLTCYDATTARLLWKGGVKTLLVGDTAAEMILGHDSTLPVSMRFMLEITAAVRRGAPDAFIMADMPFGSYQCGDDKAVRNAVRFLKKGGADCVKMEAGWDHVAIVKRMAAGGVPVVAHIGSRPQQVRAKGGYSSEGKSEASAEDILALANAMIDAGASMLLVEAVPGEVTQRLHDRIEAIRTGKIVLIGCGAGPACHGHVVVLHDVLGMTDWQPPFAPVLLRGGEAISRAANEWVKLVQGGGYLKDGGPYRMK